MEGQIGNSVSDLEYDFSFNHDAIAQLIRVHIPCPVPFEVLGL